MPRSEEARDSLRQLRAWWIAEKNSAQAARRVLREAAPWAQRLAGGLALEGLAFARREQRRTAEPTLWFGRQDRKPLPAHKIRSGYPAWVWADGDEGQSCTIVRITDRELCLRFPTDYERGVERQVIRLERMESVVTFQRGDDAIAAVMDNDELRALLFGARAPRFESAGDISWRDDTLNEGQRKAVTRTVQAKDAMLIHGPPGTGKTQTLVEVVRQGLLRRKRILVTAASNVAVDNIARRLAATRVKVLRLGAAERVAPELQTHTLRHHMSALAEWDEAQDLFDKAQRIADGKGRKVADPRRRISELRRQAHGLRDLARATVMRRARVVCCTAGGVDAVPLGDERFDLVVLDEATQAVDPVALSALVRGAVMVLAGDPKQLPPTVVSQDEATKTGLSSTLFERCADRWPTEATTMLTTQYRMSEALMKFPSDAHYGGRLKAGADNRNHSIRDLAPDLSDAEARPWILIDTSDRPAGEDFHDTTGSFHNPEHRAVVASEIHRLKEAGVALSDVAVICPYAEQVRRLREQLASDVDEGLEIGTVDGFQGREKEVVIVDLVRSNDDGHIGFLADVRRSNVALTRAKRQLLVVVNTDTVRHHPYYRDLLAAAERDGAYTRGGLAKPTGS